LQQEDEDTADRIQKLEADLANVEQQNYKEVTDGQYEKDIYLSQICDLKKKIFSNCRRRARDTPKSFGRRTSCTNGIFNISRMSMPCLYTSSGRNMKIASSRRKIHNSRNSVNSRRSRNTPCARWRICTSCNCVMPRISHMLRLRGRMRY